MKKLLIPFFALLLCFATRPADAAIVVPSHPASFDPALVRSAFDALRHMPRQERHAKLKQAKRELKNYREAKRKGKEPDTNTLLLVLLDILLPPVAVYLHEGETNNRFWITLLLFVLGLAGAFFFSWLLIFASIVYGLIVILGE